MDISKEYQTKLFPYAYNIPGSIDDAHDVIQDVIVNYIESNRDNIKNKSAYLIKSVINKSINLKKRSKKMTGQTTWLPEPIATENADKKIKVLSEFISGIKAVARLVVKGFDLYLKKCRIEFKKLNYSSALLFYRGNKLVCCQILDMDTDTGKINNIYSIVDLQKLRKL